MSKKKNKNLKLSVSQEQLLMLEAQEVQLNQESQERLQQVAQEDYLRLLSQEEKAQAQELEAQEVELGRCQELEDNIIDVKDFDYNLIYQLKLLPKGKGVKSNIKYADIVCAFDIETTNIDEYKQAVMYIWQFQFGAITVIGRLWDEFKYFIDEINRRINDNLNIVVYIHNLSFEFQWLRHILPIDDIMAMDERKILKFNSEHFEFRCSYLHSNMSLDRFVKYAGSDYLKIEGFDYSKKRYYFTKLTYDELLYCINDVRALTNAIIKEMDRDKDNLYTIPLTSTGYVRREANKVLIPYRKYIKEWLPSLEVFHGLRKAFRGGNTHANRWYAGRLMEDVYSYDISSSYPSVMLTEKYPTEFIERPVNKLEQAIKRDRACLIHIALFDVKLIDEAFGCPYLAYAKCENIIKAELDNGRILSCEQATTWITEQDFTILLSQYEFSYKVLKLYTSRKKMLPLEFRELILKMYINKTELKGSGDEYIYTKYKNMVNSVYGMTVQNPCKPNYILNGNDVVMNEDETLEELIEAYHKKGWLPYQWGVWVTAYARRKLEEGLHSIPYQSFIYADTDSIKFIGDYGSNIESLNKAYMHDDLKAYDIKGNAHYMGIYERDAYYKKFKTLGSKKYCYVDEADKLHVTISGVNKVKGAIELGSIDNFNESFIFKDAGGNEAIYNDNPPIDKVVIDGYNIDIIPNIAIYPSTYTLDTTIDYRRLINFLSNTDIRYSLHYER